jgi:CRISPR-associated endonuclease Csn1
MRTLGIDGGIASIGWALLNIDPDAGALTIEAAGVRTFDAPETAKERTPTNSVRRLHRGQRRVIRRRRQRMNQIRRLFHEAGLLHSADSEALGQKAIRQHEPELLPNADCDKIGQNGLNPWRLRAEAFDRTLSGSELAVALGHIAKHRGFKSNAKRDAGANAADETSKMKKAIEATRDRLGGKTVGQMFATDPAFKDRKRNRGDFTRSILRTDQESEVHQIFAEQRRRGNAAASEALEEEFCRTAFFQRPLQDSEHMVQFCPFEPTEKRTARRSYAFEMFRLLSRLANISLSSPNDLDRRLDASQIARIAEDFGETKGITYKTVRKTLDLDNRTRFVGVSEKDEKNDIVARSGAAAEGTYALRNIVGPSGWRLLMHNPVLRDKIAEVLSFREDPASIRVGLVEAGLDGLLLDAVMHGVQTGAFGQFTRAGHISAKAARALLEPLRLGKVYSEACEDVGYDHANRPSVSLEDVRNPVARKAVTEMCKQVRAIVHAHGLPDYIHVELARDIGKGPEERDRIKKGIEDLNKKRDKSRAALADILGRDGNDDELLRYELWHEQNGRCLYTDDPINPDWIASGDNRVQVDHILPWSRFGDDSFINKTLCMASANQAKKGRTPFEWFEAEGRDWPLFASRVEACKEMKGRKKGGFYLRKNAKEVEETFRNRNLGDTRYATRLLLDMLVRRYYPDDMRKDSENRGRHVLARPGQLTAKLRRAWGLDDIKKDDDGKRKDDDRHHALDAIVIAATTESMLIKLTRAAQEAERQGLHKGFDFKYVEQPALGFAQAVRATIETVFVSRADRHRARGEAHAATIKRVETVDGVETVFERKAVEKLTLADLELIPIPVPYGKIADPAKLRDEMVAALRSWIEANKPKDSLPRSSKGDVIRKVRVASKDKVAVSVRGGTADRGEMARVDVFTKADKRGSIRYYLVPIYPHQIADQEAYPQPPNRSVVAYAAESDWAIIDSTYDFRFSLYGNSLIEVVKSDGEVITGYFKGMHRGTGALSVAPQFNPRMIRGGIGAKTLDRFTKMNVDRLGNIKPVKNEVRTWHGVACT